MRSRGWILREFGLAAGMLLAMGGIVAAVAQTHAAESWVTTWGSAQMSPYGTERLSAGTLTDATLREVVHLSAGGSELRVKVSNVFGGTPLVLSSVHVALRPAGKAAGAIEAGSDRVLLFGGKARVSVPNGAEYVSDAMDFDAAPLSDLVVTMMIESAPSVETVHPGARATAFIAKGDHTDEATLIAPQTITRWYFLAGVEVAGEKMNAGSVITFGDSITDGHGSTTDANDRWPDVLAARLNSGPKALHMGVVNEGIGGNRILQDGLGPHAMSRMDRDVFAQAGVRTVLMLDGINDLGGLDRVEEHPAAAHAAQLEAIKNGFRQMVAQCHAHGIRVVAATLTPFMGSDYYHPSAATEGDRQALNTWIRTSGIFDGVVDFDAALRDPQRPERLSPAMDSGDHLHPGPAGYKRMGEAVSLEVLK